MEFLWIGLYKDLDKAREGMSWRMLAKKLKLTPSLFTRISQGRPISVKNMVPMIQFVYEKLDTDIWDYVSLIK